MLSRLFHTDEAHYSGKVRTESATGGGSVYEFLTTDDRKMLEGMYEYCAANGMDLTHVDALAADLATYRDNGPHSRDGTLYDLEGHRLTFDFKDSDKQIADHMLQSESLQQTSIDQGFLKFQLGKPGVHCVDFAFLEKMVSVFSPAGDVQGNSNDAFKVYKPVPYQNQIRVTKSENVELVMPEPDVSSENGVITWSTPELAAANGKGGSVNKHGIGALDQEKKFLMKKDMDLLAMLSKYADSKGIDMKHIEDLESILATYRQRQAK